MASREDNLWRSVTETTWRFYVWVGFLSLVVVWGAYGYLQQLRQGLVVTGMRDQVSWGLYITNFVFFIGISHVGALLSAILRFSGAEWRRPLTRMAEAITTASLFIGALMPVIDLGRPDRLLNLFRFARIQSPILWDIISVTTYFTGSTLFLWVLMIPDIALLRETYPNPASWRKKLYTVLSLGYRGSPKQVRLLNRATFAVTLFILPLAISVHTVVSWIFAMTLRPGWDSTIFGPYFVVGALYSGAASVILAMYVFRRVYHLEGYLEPLHFRNLGLLLLALTMLYLYFNINEYLTLGYKFPESERHLLSGLFYGDYAPYFWSIQALGVVIPMLLLMAVLGLRRYQEFIIPGTALASVLVVVGAWAKRYLIIVPTLGSPYLPTQNLPWQWTHYQPTWVEWSITAAGFAGFLLIYTLLSKLFPIVSIWETLAGEAVKVAPERVTEPVRALWGFRAFIPFIIAGTVLAAASHAHAAEPLGGGGSKPTTLLLRWQVLRPTEGVATSEEQTIEEASEPERVYLFTDRLFGPWASGFKGAEPKEPVPAIVVTATLRDTEGLPLAFKAVSFALKASFGLVQFGSRPTNEAGQAQLIVHDRRYGIYPVEVSFGGDDIHEGSHAGVLVDFGPRPPPALPPEGVLIAPYPTAAIGIPFLVFYGTIWVVFFYAFGYLVLWRMRRSSAPEEGEGAD